ncbi:DUF3017 domain-containing protein [Streptomyces sp. URMC 123]|uniref:DUF3017 domain-containing protein n=1 Tax=Streptomyces sp. URMC 123 TaxID=3423403 RepID=UPI003F1D5DFC
MAAEQEPAPGSGKGPDNGPDNGPGKGPAPEPSKAPTPGPGKGPGPAEPEPRPGKEPAKGPGNETRKAPGRGPAPSKRAAEPDEESPRGRRFTVVTRSTARPEGGGRAAPGDAPAPARQWPLLTVLGLTGLGLLVVAFGAFRVGTLVIGLALLVGAALRWALPSVGMLAVRSRFTDLLTYGLLGFMIVILALMAQPKPWLDLPWLEKAVHFTVR